MPGDWESWRELGRPSGHPELRAVRLGTVLCVDSVLIKVPDLGPLFVEDHNSVSDGGHRMLGAEPFKSGAGL